MMGELHQQSMTVKAERSFMIPEAAHGTTVKSPERAEN